MESKDVSVVLPCLNEDATIGVCIEKAQRVFRENGIDGEVIVVDNGSTDNSAKIAESLGAIVVKEPIKGYGAAYLKGFSEAKGRNVIMADSDNTYDLLEIPKLLAELKDNDMIIGSRIDGDIKEGAMPWANRHLGTPVLTALLNKFFNTKASDSQSGFRAFTKKALDRMNLQSTGMELASEIIIKASKAGLRTKEVPISYYPRKGESKLNPIKDGWRHLRFMMLYSPSYLFILPGFLLFIIGIILMSLLLGGPTMIGSLKLDIHPMILGSALAMVGFQIMTLGVYAKSYAIKKKFDKPKGFMKIVEKYANFERGLLIGTVMAIIGIFIGFLIFSKWVSSGFGELSEMRNAILALTFVIIGVQVIFSSFFLSVLGTEKR